jgi:hypothetical protein
MESPLPVDGVEMDDGQEMARYMIHVPIRDNNGQEIPHVLAMLRQTLTNSGFYGRTVLPGAQGDWQGSEQGYETEEMAIVMVDADTQPDTLEAIKEAARGVKEAAQQEAVYLTVQPLKTYLI